MSVQEIVSVIEPAIRQFPTNWDGKRAILEMKDADLRQMEWIGFYFEYLCETRLAPMMTMPGPVYGNTKFDGFKAIPWDFKSHATNSRSRDVIVNDREAIERAVQEFGEVGVILALGVADYNDEDRFFKAWHDALKGGRSDYEKERIARGASSRLRKTAFDISGYAVVGINATTLNLSGSFQQNFRNADGRPRRAKVKINLEKLPPDRVYLIEL